MIHLMDPTTPRHPMAVASRLSGLGADLIRAWERRYGAVRPARAAGERRRFSDDDIRRLVLLRRVVEAGWQIGQVAALDDGELNRLCRHAGPPPDAPARQRGRPAERLLRECLRNVSELDVEGLRRTLENASVELSRFDLLDDVLHPLIRGLHDDVVRSRGAGARRQAASTVIEGFLDGLHPAYPPSPADPEMLVGLPAGDFFEPGARLAAAIGRNEGWHATYLGPNLPAEEMAAAAKVRRARLVLLGIASPEAAAGLDAALDRLHRVLPSAALLVVEASLSPEGRTWADTSRAVCACGPGELRRVLREARWVGGRPATSVSSAQRTLAPGRGAG
jgi:DNA-binding transcriptional MerR regulator